MRDEGQMLSLITQTARGDERIRAAVLHGSRVNPNVPADDLRDYDVVYLVREIDSFLHDPGWIDRFGPRLMLQTPETQELLPPEGNGCGVYLMLFEDGTRMDLSLVPVERHVQLMEPDSLTRVLLDKDGIFGQQPPASDRDYWTKPPTPKLFEDCQNEFWWVQQNVAKGILRRELPYAMRMLSYVRDMVDVMTAWWIGMAHDYRISSGKCGKYFETLLPGRLWELYRAGYPAGDYDQLWRALECMGQLFRETGQEVARRFGFRYRWEEDRNMTAYLSRLRESAVQRTERRAHGLSPEQLADLSLREITCDNFWKVVELSVTPPQQEFVASNAVSIAQAKVQTECVPLAVYLGGRPVGFVMYCLDRQEREYWIYRVMVDQRFQSLGIGRRALELLLTRIRADGQHHKVYISFEPTNHWARSLYERLGFVDDGREVEGETVYRLDY